MHKNECSILKSLKKKKKLKILFRNAIFEMHKNECSILKSLKKKKLKIFFRTRSQFPRCFMTRYTYIYIYTFEMHKNAFSA